MNNKIDDKFKSSETIELKEEIIYIYIYTIFHRILISYFKVSSIHLSP